MSVSTKRWIYFILILAFIPAGLATRQFRSDLPFLVATYGGDVLSAACIFLFVRFLFAKISLYKITGLSYLICISIETFQLYKAEWIQSIRHTPPFGILLGYGFLWSDLLCYAIGVLVAFFIAWIIETKHVEKVNKV